MKPELKEIFDRIKAEKENRIKLKNEESKKIIQNEKIIQKENSNLIEERKSQVRQKITMFEEKKITMSEERRKSLRSDAKIRSDVRSPISGRKFKSKNSRKLEGKLKLANKFNPVGKEVLENDRFVLQKSIRDFWVSKEMKEN